MVEVTAVAPPTPVAGDVPLWWGLHEKVDVQLAPMSTASREGRHGAARPTRRKAPFSTSPLTWASYMGQLHGPASAQAGLWLATSPQPNPQEAHAWGCTGVLLASARLAALVGAKERGVAATTLREIQGWVAQ